MTRRNAWTSEQDQLVVEIVDQNLKEGKSLVKAFEQASNRIGRSEGAIKFRWNTLLKQRYFIEKRSSKKKTTLKLSDLMDYLVQLQDYAVYLQNENQRLQKMNRQLANLVQNQNFKW